MIYPIHKKGDKTLCDNYRGMREPCRLHLQRLDVAYMVFARAISNTLNQYQKKAVGDYQGALGSFRKTFNNRQNI